MNKKEGMNLRWWNVFCTEEEGEETRGRHEQSKETDGKGKNKRLQKCVSEWENQGDAGINLVDILFFQRGRQPTVYRLLSRDFK